MPAPRSRKTPRKRGGCAREAHRTHGESEIWSGSARPRWWLVGRVFQYPPRRVVTTGKLCATLPVDAPLGGSYASPASKGASIALAPLTQPEIWSRSWSLCCRKRLDDGMRCNPESVKTAVHSALWRRRVRRSAGAPMCEIGCAVLAHRGVCCGRRPPLRFSGDPPDAAGEARQSGPRIRPVSPNEPEAIRVARLPEAALLALGCFGSGPLDLS